MPARRNPRAKGRSSATILLVGAHPDDEIHAAGAILNHTARGHRAVIVTMTRGGMGHMSMPTEELKRVRSREARACAKVLGAELVLLDHEDSAVPYSRDVALELARLYRQHRPVCVLTHGPDDPHPDHRNTHKGAIDAFYLASLPLLDLGYPYFDLPQILCFGGRDPDVYVDISKVMEKKIRAASKHKSQFESWLVEHKAGVDRKYTTRDIYGVIPRRAQAVGSAANVEYAEAFTSFFRPAPQATELLPGVE
ncbi:MAG: PIG-L family deacetylase [Armatimonadota bacterium]|nr:MAG: PIG-L family deacetylase [Armatimonadota bacterium]